MLFHHVSRAQMFVDLPITWFPSLSFIFLYNLQCHILTHVNKEYPHWSWGCPPCTAAVPGQWDEVSVWQASVDQCSRGPGHPGPDPCHHPAQCWGPGHCLYWGPSLFAQVSWVVHQESVCILVWLLYLLSQMLELNKMLRKAQLQYFVFINF